MKKVVLVFVFCLIAFFVSAEEFKICIYPENTELNSLLSDYLKKIESNSTQNIKYSLIKCDKINCTNDDLVSGDKRLMEYICNKSGCDLLLIPVIESITDYAYTRIFSFSKQDSTFALEYESVDKMGSSLDSYAIASIGRFFENGEYILPESYDDIIEDERTLVRNTVVLDCSNTVAMIYIDDKYVGDTPYTLEEFHTPAVVRFSAEGYADRVLELTEKTKGNMTVSMKTVMSASTDAFTKNQIKYYKSFARTILAWGSRAALRAINIENEKLNKVLDYTLLGVAAASSIDLGFNIYRYFKSVQSVTP